MLEKTETKDGTIGKALTILDIVEGFHKPIKFNDILEKSPFPKPSTYRMLQNLVSQEMLSFDPATGQYALGSRLIRLAHSAWRHASLAPIASTALDQLALETGETIHLAQLDHGQVLYIDKRNAARPVPMFSDAGKIGPAYCTGVGKAMLAFCDAPTQEKIADQQSFYPHTKHTITDKIELLEELQKIHGEGFAFDREEHEPNIICLATPILSEAGNVIGGISITSTTAKTNLEQLCQHKPALQNAAKTIAAQAKIWMLPNIGG